MRRFFFSTSPFLCALLALYPVAAHGQAPTPDPSPAAERQVSGRAEPCLHLRSGASLDRSILECLDPGTSVRILGEISGWSQVRLLDGTEGWVDSTYLEAAPAAPAPTAVAAPASAARPEDDLQGQIEALEGQLQAMSALRVATEERLRRAVAAAEELQIEAGRLRQRVRALEQERAGSAAGLDAEQQRRIEALDAARAAGRAGEAELRQALAAAEKRWRSAVEDRDRKAREIAELQAALPPDSPRRAELKQELKQVRAQLRDAAKTNSRQIERIDELTRQLAAAQGRLAAAQPAERPEPPPEPALEPKTEPTPAAPVKVRAPIVAAPGQPAVSVRQPLTPAVEAAPASPAATPAEQPRSATDAAIDTVRAWAAAWSDQRVDDFLSYYAASFRPADGLDRGDWEAQCFDRLSRPSYIRVTISSLRAEPTADGAVRATFRQDYESDTSADTVSKALTLADEGGAWRIVAEEASP